MARDERPHRIREEDVQSRSLPRRAFLGRFGAAAGIAGLVGFTLGCEPTDSCDEEDQSDPIMTDGDGTDQPFSDQDVGDPCDSDGV